MRRADRGPLILMKAYLMTTGLVFAAIAAAHILRVAAEGIHLITDPFFILMTAAALGLGVWALRLLLSSRKS